MLNLLRNLFSRRSRRLGEHERRQPAGLGRMFGGRRGLTLGTVASIAIPYLMRRLGARRAQRTGLAAR